MAHGRHEQGAPLLHGSVLPTRPAHKPTARLNLASSHTSFPSARAFANLLPASGPAMSTSMFAETAPRTRAPAAEAAAVAAARGVESVPVKTMFFPERPPPPARALAFGAPAAGEAARLAPALALGAGDAALAFALGAGDAALAFAFAPALAFAFAAALAAADMPLVPAV